MNEQTARKRVRCEAERRRSSPKYTLWAARTSPYAVRTDNALKVRFSASVGEEPEVEVGLV